MELEEIHLRNDQYQLYGGLKGDRESVEDVPLLLAALQSVLGLHKPETRWMPYEDANVSYDTEAEAREVAGYTDLEPGTEAIAFRLCAHCKVIEEAPCEGECTREAGYRESIWPCPTVTAITAALEVTP